MTFGRRWESRRIIQEKYPHLIAVPFGKAISTRQSPAGRLGSLVDAFESTLLFLAYAQLSRYVELRLRDAKVDALLAEHLLGRGSASTGTWLNLLVLLTRALAERSFFPELFAEFGSKGQSTLERDLLELTKMRNAELGHGINRTDERSRWVVDEHLEKLERLLTNELKFLRDVTTLVPMVAEGERVIECAVYLGECEPVLEGAADVSAHGLVRPRATVMLMQPSGDTLVTYPFLCYRDASDEQQRRIAVLSRLNWAKGHRLRSAYYMLRDDRAAGTDLRHVHDDLRRTLGWLIERHAEAGQRESRHHFSIPSVWQKKEHAKRVFVGREDSSAEILDAVIALRGTGGVVCIVGGPGIGKSTLIANLHDRFPSGTCLYHTMSASVEPRHFLRALIHQADEHLGGVLSEEVYAAPSLEELRGALETALELVATRFGAAILLVDALDELRAESGWEAAMDWFPRNLGPGIVAVVSSRPVRPILQRLGDFAHETRRIELPGLSQADILPFTSRYVGGEIALALSTQLDLRRIFERVQGFPLFFQHAVEDAARRLASAGAEGSAFVFDYTSIPADTAGHLRRILDSASARTKRGRRAIEFLCCARPPGLNAGLFRSLLQASLGERLDSYEVDAVVAPLGQVAHEPVAPGHYLPSHRSIVDHVLREVLSDEDLHDRHRTIARVLDARGQLDSELYWEENLVAHAELGQLPAQERARMATTPALLRHRVVHGAGAEHGQLIRRQFEGLSESEEALRCADLRSTCEALLHHLDIDARAELASMLTRTHVGSLCAMARDLFEELWFETRRVDLGVAGAWVAYQALDDWTYAIERLRACLESGQGDEVWRASTWRLLACVSFDSGAVLGEPERILRDECLPVFEQFGRSWEVARTRETLGVILDAEARWIEAIELHRQAEQTYRARADTASLGRVLMNRGLSSLWGKGLAESRALFDEARGCVPQGGRQLREYFLVNQAVLHLIGGDLDEFDATVAGIDLDEEWLSATLDESFAIRRWFGGEPEAALQTFRAAAFALDELDDAWAGIDHRINAGLVAVDLQLPSAREELVEAQRLAVARGYDLGRALAAEGLRRLGAPEADSAGLELYATRLSRIFEGVRSPFSPGYAPLLP